MAPKKDSKKKPASSKKDEKELARLCRRRRTRSTIARPCDWKRKGHAYRLVWAGVKKKTSGGLTKKNLTKNKKGRIVSKIKSSIGKYRWRLNGLDAWSRSMMGARETLGLTGFVKVKPASKGGTEKQAQLYAMTQEAYLKKSVESFNTKMAAQGHNTKAVLQIQHQAGIGGAETSPPLPASAASWQAVKSWPAAGRREDGSVDVD